jgi:hypothetical protein
MLRTMFEFLASFSNEYSHQFDFLASFSSAPEIPRMPPGERERERGGE